MPDPESELLIRQLRADLLKAKTTWRKSTVDLASMKEQLDKSVQERSDLKQLADKAAGDLQQAKQDFNVQIANQVQAAVERTSREFEASSANWQQERATLKARIDELERTVPRPTVSGKVTPTVLAAKFAAVLEDLAAQPPSPDRKVTAALTEMRIEARGILEAPQNAADEPRLVTLEAGTPASEHISTIVMTFKAVPNITIRGGPAE